MPPRHATVRKSQSAPDAPSWSLGQRRIASILLLTHSTLVFFGVWAAVPPFSRLTREIADVAQPYLQAAYLNHGYRFFAPNPEASHLIRYEVHRSGDASSVVEGHWPDPMQHWPRLYYHRHLMIAETLFVLTNAPPPDAVAPPERARWEQQRGTALALVAGLRRHLQSKYASDDVRLWLVEHQLPAPPDVASGRRLNDPGLYHERALDELLAPASVMSTPAAAKLGDRVR